MSVAAPLPEELTALCREWQERLRLQDWRMKVRFAEKFELDGKQAQCRMVSTYKQALILINPYATHEDYGVDPIEVALLHEMVHIHLDVLMPKEMPPMHNILYEQAVDLLAWALYRAKYGDKVKDAFLEA